MGRCPELFLEHTRTPSHTQALTGALPKAYRGITAAGPPGTAQPSARPSRSSLRPTQQMALPLPQLPGNSGFTPHFSVSLSSLVQWLILILRTSRIRLCLPTVTSLVCSTTHTLNLTGSSIPVTVRLQNHLPLCCWHDFDYVATLLRRLQWLLTAFREIPNPEIQLIIR